MRIAQLLISSLLDFAMTRTVANHPTTFVPLLTTRQVGRNVAGPLISF